MIWFGSSAGVALSNQFPEAKSALAWVRGGWHVAVAYVVGFLVMLAIVGWHADPPARTACDCIPDATSPYALRENPGPSTSQERTALPSSAALALASGDVHNAFTRRS